MPASDDFESTITAFETVCADARRRQCRSGYFAAMYAKVTTTVRDQALAGRFADPGRMEHFVAAFAGRYLDAHAAWRAGLSTPASWAAAFGAVGHWRPIVLQHLLLGMNAHINLDLGIVAAELGGDGPGLVELRSDFEAINDVLASLVDADQSVVNRVSPWFGIIDRLGGEADEMTIRFSLRRARAASWELAERLVAVPAEQRRAEIDRVDTVVAGFAGHVLRPGGRLAAPLLLVRLRERRPIPEVIDLLGT